MVLDDFENSLRRHPIPRHDGKQRIEHLLLTCVIPFPACRCLLSHRLIEFERERRLVIVVSRTNESCGRNAGQIVEESDRFRVTVEHVRMATRILGRHLFHQLFGLLEEFLVGSGVVALLLDQVFEELGDLVVKLRISQLIPNDRLADVVDDAFSNRIPRQLALLVELLGNGVVNAGFDDQLGK